MILLYFVKMNILAKCLPTFFIFVSFGGATVSNTDQDKMTKIVINDLIFVVLSKN